MDGRVSGPGAQTRRKLRNSRAVEFGYLVVGVLLPAFFLLQAYLFLRLGVTLVAVGFALVALGVGTILFRGSRKIRRARWPLQASGIELELLSGALRRGQPLRAYVRGENVEVGLLCVESYDDKQQASDPMGDSSTALPNRVVCEALVHETWVTVAPQAADKAPVELLVPIGSPYSYEGDVMSFSWRLVARRSGDTSGRIVRRPVWVAP